MNGKMLAEKCGVVSVDTIDHQPFVEQKMVLIPYLFAKQKTVLPVDQNEKRVLVAVADPLDLNVLKEVRLFLHREVEPLHCPKEVIEAAIERCYGQKEGETNRFLSNLQQNSVAAQRGDSLEEYDLLDQGNQNPVIKIVDTIFIEAIQQKASDIHFEPKEHGLSVRYRIDGVLQQRHTPPQEYQLSILTRIKVMAKLDIAEMRLPQDGRIKLRYGGREIDFRVSTLPVSHGERIVLRILDRGNILLGLDTIGMNEQALSIFRKLIHHPEGIILVTGPTGSGKTTTLYSALSELNAAQMNIMTIEDPVEYKLSGISQMHVNRKIDLNFSTGLRHILRQDPDVIFIGEIRDKETAKIAIQSSLTGHLVFSTLHTNDAPSALTRLADMGIESYLLASSILGVIAQRLVRVICPDCQKGYVPSKEELLEIGIKELKENSQLFYRGTGCSSCFGTGYKGRLGIYECMLMNGKIKEQVIKNQNAEEIRKVAVSEGMVPLFYQGVQMVFEGKTTVEEVLRVTRLALES
jgi:general secretion pathway protein E